MTGCTRQSKESLFPAGLGFPPGFYDLNGNKYMNSVLQKEKDNMGKKGLSLPQYTRLI